MNVKLLKKGLFIFLISFYSLTSYSQKIHEVKKGETLFAISKMYEIPIDSLININELNNYSLSIGQKLIVELEIPKKNDELPQITNNIPIRSVAKPGKIIKKAANANVAPEIIS